MEQHHQNSINNLLKNFENDSSIQAILLGGSIAHGFAKPYSDIDISIIISKEDYQKRKKEKNLVYVNKDLCTYENGYIDGKYIDCDFLRLVAQKGSDPARFAFKDNIILFSKIDDLEELLREIVCYPNHQKKERIKRFAAQLLAWKWYYSEAVRKNSYYLTYLSLQKIILFSSRIILAYNELFYPYHKWLLSVLHTAKVKPASMMDDIDSILKNHSLEKVNEFCRKILDFIDIEESNIDWPNQFMKDSELNWVDREAPVDDI